MTELCLVRHGQTDWNLEGRYMGQSDIPLNATGRSQAYDLAEKLKGDRFFGIYTSDLQRAQETANTIAAALNLPVTTDARLREINQGDWEGKFLDIIRNQYAELWKQRTTDPASIRPPGGETVREVAERVYAAVDDIAHIHPTGCVLIVSHGLALATVLCKVRSIPIGQAYSVIPENTEPIWVEWYG
jgi:broad specificity phosphatase PhoE